MNILFPLGVSLIGLFFLLINNVLYLKTLKGKDNLYKTLSVYLLFLAVEEIICTVIGVLIPNANFFLTHFNFNIQLLILSYFFYQLFKNSTLKKLTLLLIGLVWVLLSCQYFYKPDLFWKFNIPEILTISFILISYSLIHLYNNLGEEKKYFYFVIGLGSYLACSSIIYMSGNFELTFITEPVLIDIWIFNSIFFIIFQYFIFKEWKALNSKN